MRRWLLVYFLLLVPARVLAQETVVGDAQATEASIPKPALKKVFDNKFIFLGVGLNVATGLDTYSTYASREWCPTCTEGNPFAAPVINNFGPGVAYPAGMAWDGAVLWFSGWMRKSDNPALNKIWWVPPVAGMLFHSLGIKHNFGLKERCKFSHRECGL